MATQADDIREEPAEPDIGQEDGTDQQPDTGEDSPYAELAKEMGWVPRDQYQGDPDSWKPADQYIRDGRDIQRETSRELKTVREQLDTIAKTSASIVEQQIQERFGELSARYAKAVEDDDKMAALKLAGELHKLAEPAEQSRPRPSPDAQAWVDRNAHWFKKPGHEFATARAIEICNTLAGQGYTDHATQLRIAEQRLRQEGLLPGQKNGKPPAGVHAPGGRGAAPSNRKRGFADMPPDAQKVARDMEERGTIGSREDYAKNYWRNLEGKV